MNKILFILTLFFTHFVCSQTNYKKIEIESLNKDKSQIAENFIQSYLDKCSNKNYSEFTEFSLSKGYERFMNQKLEEICLNDQKITEKLLSKISIRHIKINLLF